MTSEETSEASGFAAMGKPVPNARRDAAYTWARENGAEREEAFSMVERVASHIARDRPYEALQDAQKTMGATGGYVVMAYLLTGPVS